MEHKAYAIANWKMQLRAADSAALAKQIISDLPSPDCAHVVLCPSFTSLHAVGEVVRGNPHVTLGAQDVFWEDTGNYTGEVSVPMLEEGGATHVIIGHSERRQHLRETDDMVDRKVAAVTRHGLVPVICVGETADQRRSGDQQMVVVNQVRAALRYLPPTPQHHRVIICYEPIWSINPGRPCDPDEAKVMAGVIRQTLVDLYPTSMINPTFRIIYGGSVTSENVSEYVDKDLIFGVLVGTASRDPKAFRGILTALS